MIYLFNPLIKSSYFSRIEKWKKDKINSDFLSEELNEKSEKNFWSTIFSSFLEDALIF